VLRIIRITLLALVPMVAVATVAGCDDDTQSPAAQDLSGTVHDQAMPVSHDMADHD
jgi:hypothetical protein